MAFYASIEYFKHFVADSFDISSDGRRITRIEDMGRPQRTVYGSNVIPFESYGIHEWRVKIHKGFCIILGIDEACYKWKRAPFWKRNTSNYAYAQLTGRKCSSNIRRDFLNPFHDGDVIKIVLNMNDKTIWFAKNNITITKAYDIKETENGYCLAVYMRTVDDCIELLSYKHTH